MHMPTLEIDKALLAKAQQLTGLRRKAAVLNAGLEALIARESGRQLIALGRNRTRTQGGSTSPPARYPQRRVMLVDTTVWVDHLRRGDEVLVGLLEHLQVTVHPFVVGELACGHIRNRPAVLAALRRLPAVPVMEHADVLAYIEVNKLMGRGLGWVDVNLLVSADAAGEKLLTRDRRLKGAAESLGLA